MISIKNAHLLTLQSVVVTLCATTFNIQKYNFLPTELISVFCMVLRANDYYYRTPHYVISC
jgi:hypothetical protein